MNTTKAGRAQAEAQDCAIDGWNFDPETGEIIPAFDLSNGSDQLNFLSLGFGAAQHPLRAENDNAASDLAISFGADQAITSRNGSYIVNDSHTSDRSRAVDKHWSQRRKFGDLSRTTCIPFEAYREAHGAWHYARESFRGIDTLLTIMPVRSDHLDPVERHNVWNVIRNKLQSTCRRLGFDFTAIMFRESSNSRGDGEHSHILMWVPKQHRRAFDAAVKRWEKGGKGFPPLDVDVRRANYRTTYTRTGKRRNAISYGLKAAPPQARRADKALWYKPGGTIYGWRCKVTRNLCAARQQEHRELARSGAINPALAIHSEIVVDRPTITNSSGQVATVRVAALKAETKAHRAERPGSAVAVQETERTKTTEPEVNIRSTERNSPLNSHRSAQRHASRRSDRGPTKRSMSLNRSSVRGRASVAQPWLWRLIAASRARNVCRSRGQRPTPCSRRWTDQCIWIDDNA